MPAKWQQWMPFQIDRFKASPSVRAMHPAARIGYLYLLACQWQSSDCSIPSDPLTLAEMSELGDELWATYGPRILRKFEPVNGDGTLRNAVCYGEWLEAKRIFDARREGAQRTNTVRSPKNNERSPNGHRVEMPRSADTRTTVVGVDVDVPVSVPVNDELSPEMVARGLADILGLSLGYGPGSFNTAVTEVARTALSHGADLRTLAVEMEAAYRFYLQEKPTLRIQWGPTNFFGQGHWRDPTGWPRKEKTRSEKIDTWEPSE
jgi:hypothetical protein